MRCERPPDSLRSCPDLHADLYQRQPAEVEVGCFVDAGRVETPASDRDVPTGQMLRYGPSVDAKQRGQLHQRRTVAIPRHKIIDLLGAQKGLSHLK